MASKTLTVLGAKGAGKKTLIGSLIYKCGMGLEQLAQLERSTNGNYADIVSFFEEKDITKSFYTPSANIVIEQSTKPDIACWVVDATDPDRGRASSSELISLITAGLLQPKDKLLILINKMDLIHWSEDVFKETATAFDAVDSKPARAYIIPISALQGGNVLEMPNGLPWPRGDRSLDHPGPEVVTERTLMQVLG
ncbi:hypothetical protein BR93DRAFT_969397 [Coniochaeta sp. PMI_546]|nr:hypothetical protein BR93DRAFT_969397 [Coniochaeta sp. PMI_546]